MRILIAVVSFRYLTGAELYVYELSRCLAARGHDVTIASETGGGISARARANGVRVCNFSSVPLSLGFDVMHVQELGPARWAMDRYPSTPVIATVHSQWPCESPLVDERIHRYVCIRPEVRDKVVREDGIPRHKTAIVYNGVDFARFNAGGAEMPERDLVLFAGTVDPLRRAAALHLIERAVDEDFDVRFIGTRHSSHLDGPLPPNVRWLQGDVWEIERHVKACTATAGIVLGRTTIEGWACGKPGIVYDVDLAGEIRDVIEHPPPHRDLIRQFDAEFMTDEIEMLYEEAAGVRPEPARATGVDRLARLDRLRRRPASFDVDPGRQAVLAFAEEVVLQPDLLVSWADAFGDCPDATLVIYARGGDEAAWAERVEAALAAAGLAGRDDLDLLLVIGSARESLADAPGRFAGVLSDEPPHRLLEALPHVSGRRVRELRAAAEPAQAAAA